MRRTKTLWVGITIALVVTACGVPEAAQQPRAAAKFERRAQVPPERDDGSTDPPSHRRLIEALRAEGYGLDELADHGYLVETDGWPRVVELARGDCERWARDPAGMKRSMTTSWELDFERIVVSAMCPENLEQVPTEPLPAFTVAELDATVGAAARAWVESPSGPTFDALAASASMVLASGRPLPTETLTDGSGWAAEQLLQYLTKYPGSDAQVVEWLRHLQLPTVELPATTATVP